MGLKSWGVSPLGSHCKLKQEISVKFNERDSDGNAEK